MPYRRGRYARRRTYRRRTYRRRRVVHTPYRRRTYAGSRKKSMYRSRRPTISKFQRSALLATKSNSNSKLEKNFNRLIKALTALPPPSGFAPLEERYVPTPLPERPVSPPPHEEPQAEESEPVHLIQGIDFDPVEQ